MIIQMNSKGCVGADLKFNTEKDMYFHNANEKEGFNARRYHKRKNY